MTIRANQAFTREYGKLHVRVSVVTYRASGDVSSGEVTPKLPRPSVAVGDPREPASGRRGPKLGASYRTFGTVAPTRGRWQAFYVGPDRHRHTAGLTFSNQVRAQGWLATELGLIERGEWTPPTERRRQVEAAALTFDEFARDWIENRLLRGPPLKDRTREHYLDIHQRWFTALHARTLSAITGLDVEGWFHGLPDAPTMRSHAYSLLKSIFRTAFAHRLVTESLVAVEGATPKDITLLTVAQVQIVADAMPPRHRLLVRAPLRGTHRPAPPRHQPRSGDDHDRAGGRDRGRSTVDHHVEVRRRPTHRLPAPSSSQTSATISRPSRRPRRTLWCSPGSTTDRSITWMGFTHSPASVRLAGFVIGWNHRCPLRLDQDPRRHPQECRPQTSSNTDH